MSGLLSAAILTIITTAVCYVSLDISVCMSSAVTLFVVWQEGHLACKNCVVGCWHGYLSEARCRFAFGPADATATHYPDWFYQNGSAFLMPAYPGCPGKRPLNECSSVVVVV